MESSLKALCEQMQPEVDAWFEKLCQRAAETAIEVLRSECASGRCNEVLRRRLENVYMGSETTTVSLCLRIRTPKHIERDGRMRSKIEIDESCVLDYLQRILFNKCFPCMELVSACHALEEFRMRMSLFVFSPAPDLILIKVRHSKIETKEIRCNAKTFHDELGMHASILIDAGLIEVFAPIPMARE